MVKFVILCTFFGAAQIYGAGVAYYAHPISLYNTPEEVKDIALIRALGFEILNPNEIEHERGFKEHGMAYFEDLVRTTDVLFFRAFSDGAISAGVAKEIAAMGSGPVLELPSDIGHRTLSVGETLKYLKWAGVDVGNYLRPGECAEGLLKE